MAVTSRRERHRLSTLAEIKTTARAQMAERGAGDLSLREVARQMGLSSAAIYRYFANRDDLVTALIVDAYDDLAGELESTAVATWEQDLFERFLALTLTYRAWALAHPADYALILGTPIPGYDAPESITQPAAHRSMTRFIEVVMSARGGASLAVATDAAKDASSTPGLARLPHDIRAIALAGWAQLHGLVSLELYGHFAVLEDDPAALFRREMTGLAERVGLRPLSDDDTDHDGAVGSARAIRRAPDA